MAVTNKDAVNNFGKIKANVENSYQTFEDNRKRFADFMRFVFKDSLSQSDKDVLNITGKPTIQFNILEPYISRLLGEFAKQEPNLEVHSANSEIDPMTIEVVEGILRSILFEAKNDQIEYSTYRESLGGGYSVLQVWTEYEHEKSFAQRIRLGKVFDPTLTGFDPLAREPHKQDGKYCFELYPMSIEDFQARYPDEDISDLTFTRNIEGFNWSYQNNKQKVVLVCRYHQRRKKRYRIIYLTNGDTVTEDEYNLLLSTWNSIEQPPQEVRRRWTEKEVIERYEFIEDRILEKETTQLPSLPLLFVDGNSVYVKQYGTNCTQQVTRPYAYHAMGAQQLKNFAGQCMGNELENMMQNKYIVDKDSIPEDAIEDWTTPQKAATLIWQSRDKDGEQLPAPIAVNRTQIPNIIGETFMGAERTVQNILGSYDAQLGINENQLSGVAIVEGATQNNAVAMPYIVNYMSALNAAAQMIVEMIPLYYNTPRTLSFIDREGQHQYLKVNQMLPNGTPMPGVPQLIYPQTTLNVNVTAGYNFEVQKQRALKTIISLMQASEGFKAMMEQGGLPTLIDNLDIKGSDQLKVMADEFTKEMAQQRQMAQQAAASGQQQNPEMLSLSLKAKDQNFREEKLAVDSQLDTQRLQLENQKMLNERLKILAEANESVRDHMIRLIEAQTERQAKAADVAMKHMEHVNRSNSNSQQHLSKEQYQ